ncbi:ankyrin repeat domain-containing protein 54 [Patella vulgata]|uniref:ankyrin repeat domain-containing protein 54 n=1 Tax=Patella vulgata TaxID=6465 RepID=UPI00217F34D0|nr:ankyrin repeat domain-containing protein 54 [Patella vulgata]
MNQDTDDSDSDSLVSSSSEGEFQLPENDEPKFNFEWNPEPPAGLHFMCLVPFHQDYQANYNQSSHIGKIKVSSSHRQQRMNEFKSGRTTGRNFLDEKKLRNAATQNNHQLVIELLDNGVDPCNQDDKRRTALHFAASQGHDTTVRILLDKGADPNMRDVMGNTPLHLAVCTCQIPVVTLLLKAGTNLKAADNHGRTPLSLAKSRLKLLSSNQSYSSERLKREVTEVSDMMKTYLNLSGMKDDASQIEELCARLHITSSRDELDNINNLLSDFTSMNIRQEENPG